MKTGDRLLLFAAEGFGTGLAAKAPGTFGSLPGVAICWGLWQLEAVWWHFLLVWLIMFLLGIPLCTRAAELRQRKDPGSVVWDEMTAFPLIFVFVPPDWSALILSFLYFRVFDILKPSPVRTFERLPKGLGIMADDQIAALYATAVLWVTLKAL